MASSPKKNRRQTLVRILCGFLAFLIAGSSLAALLSVL